jgi:hypothetical protein
MVIYQVVFPNAKMYIGKSINFKNRMYHHLRNAKNGSNLIFHRAINKYGSENLEWNIIYECEDLNLLNEKEIFFINYYNTTDPNFGYNMICGDKIEPGLRKNFDPDYQVDIIKRKLKGNGHDPNNYIVLTKEIGEEIKKDYVDNLFSIKRLVRKYKITVNRINRFLISENIEIDTNRCVLTNSKNLNRETIDSVINKYKEGKSINKISSEENLTIMIVSRILHDEGIRESKRFKNGKRYDGKQPKSRKSNN